MKRLAAAAVAMTLMSGCQTMDPYTGEQKTSQATKGAGIGAVAGAVLGALVSDDRKKGALTGALVGGAAGGGVGYYMDRQEETLRQELEGTGVRVQRNGDDILLVMPGNITFATGSSELDYGFTPVLDSVVKVLQKYEETTLQVDGFTDSRGSETFNQRLSERRSGAVAQYLVSSGVQPSRVDSRGWGERHPVANNETAAGQALNRRVELNIRGVEAPDQ